MKTVTIPFAQGADQSVDPRMAPNGTLTRVENLRINREGKMVLRNGYQSLGLTVHGTSLANNLVPFDLHNADGALVALGNHNAGVHTGIRAAYQYVNTLDGKWRSSPNFSQGSVTTNNSWLQIAAADSVRVTISGVYADKTDRVMADSAVNTSGLVAKVSSISGGLVFQVIDPANGVVVFAQTVVGSFPQVFAIGTKFFVAIANAGALGIQTFDTATDVALSTLTAIAAATQFEAVPLEGVTTDYLVVYGTGTGFTVERRTTAHAVVWTTPVVAFVGGAYSVCGIVGQYVTVLSTRAVSGAELRTFNPTTGAGIFGPTNVDATGNVMTWLGVSAQSTTQVLCCLVTEATLATTATFFTTATSAAHVLTTHRTWSVARMVAKPLILDGCAFGWLVLGGADVRPFALVSPDISATNSNGGTLSAVAFDGLAKIGYVAANVGHIGHVSRNATTGKCYTALVTVDPRDKMRRSNLLEFQLFSGNRRQGALAPDGLFLAGGVTTRFDGLTSEAGADSVPAIITATATTGGSLAAGDYQSALVYRFVSRNGDVQRSSPSSIVTTTVGGANTSISYVTTSPYGLLRGPVGAVQDAKIFIDLFVTEPGGSIPRLVFSNPISGGNPGQTETFASGAALAIQQAGQPLYTQGADGAVSGRIPLGLASACQFINEAGGKMLLGGLERDAQFEISIERRPGETQGFLNDDIVFGSNVEALTAVASGSDGRRFLFSPNNVREVLGEGPNAAGIGELSEPIEIDGQVGCNDWRSVCRTEHGIFFRSDDTKIYLLPSNGGSSLSAAESIQDILEQFPVTTSAVRHDADQLLTFSVQTADGTDGRLVHLDLKTSGMDPRRGWVGRWIVDRVPQLERVPDIEVIGEDTYANPGLAANVLLKLPNDRVIGDRIVWFATAQGSISGQALGAPVAGYTRTGAVTAVGVAQAWYERIIDGTETVDTGVGLTQFGTAMVHRWHLRGAHASQVLEATTASPGTVASADPPLLTPSFGSARCLWFTTVAIDGVNPAFNGIPLCTDKPASFDHEGDFVVARGGVEGGEIAWGRRILTAASLDPGPFVMSQPVGAIVSTVAIRPAAATVGTPVRASTHYNGRLVVCNATDVLISTAGSVADGASGFIKPLAETATIYAMGPAGASRHMGMLFVGEYRDRCVLHCALSYDDGLTYTELQTHALDEQRYTTGQVVRVRWVPKRRKVEGVKALFYCTEKQGVGPSECIVFQECVFEFDDIMGPSRLPSFFRK